MLWEYEIEEEKINKKKLRPKKITKQLWKQKFESKNLKSKLKPYEDHKVITTINDVAESVERMRVSQFLKWVQLILNVWKIWVTVCKTKVIGQDKALKQWHAIRRNRAGFDEGTVQSVASLVGPTGVGKTDWLNN